MKWEFRITGLGGQGAITIGHILGRAAVLYDNKEAVVTEGYSPYITGGWSRADVIVSDDQIDYPYVSKLDILVAMYQEGLDLNVKLLKPDSTVLVEKRLVDTAKVKNERKVIGVPATELAERLGRKILANVVLLGALAANSNAVTMDSLRKAVADRFPKATELNLKALEAGFDIMELTGGERRVA
ncbi:MAG: 2-oxoacid:acceptor oxidoreductase family protein [Nitrososphaerales archaeon]|nr:2-oxoacid:acceptor oxidoreductase family protein [Nitrososphaerales archaeon]